MFLLPVLGPAEEDCSVLASNSQLAAGFALNPGAFSKGQNGDAIFLQELAQPRPSSLPHMPFKCIVVLKVSVDLERNQAKCFKAVGETIGISFVVLIVGQARFVPAEEPI